jgi:hypothetical protein
VAASRLGFLGELPIGLGLPSGLNYILPKFLRVGVTPAVPGTKEAEIGRINKASGQPRFVETPSQQTV